MQCPECFKNNMMEVEMNHIASYVVAKDVIEYEEQCPQCGTRYEGVLVKKEPE
jgi:YgiT-type zinc finger domain-containing protein